MKKVWFAMALFLAGFGTQAHSAFNSPGSGYVAGIGYDFNAGRFQGFAANVYDYIGGNYRYQIRVTETNTSYGITARQDLTKMVEVIENAFTNYKRVYSFYNGTRNEPYCYHRDQCSISLDNN